MEKTVRRCLVAAGWGGGEHEYVHVLIMCNVVVNAGVTVATPGLKFISVATKTVRNSSGQQNYMGEVSRVLIASPGPRLMETFLLIVFSSLKGIDAPYFCLFFFFKYYYLIFYYYSSDGCCSVM